MSMESPKEFSVLPQDQEWKGLSQDHRPRPQNDSDPHKTSTVKPEYPATQRVKKVTEIEYDEERPGTITKTVEVVPDKIPINTEEPAATSSSKKGQVIGAKAASSSTSGKIRTRSKIPVTSKLRFVSDKDLPKFTEINNFSMSVKPIKTLSRLLEVDGNEEENGLQFPVNNEESILDKSSDGMKKINDVENDGYQRRNTGCDGSQTSDITQRCKLKIQQRDNGNSVAEKSETNVQDYSSEARGNYEQNLSSAVANQPFILGYPSATPDNHQQNLSSAVATTIDNCQQLRSLAVANHPLVLAPFILGTCQVLIPYYCGMPTYSMLIQGVC